MSISASILQKLDFKGRFLGYGWDLIFSDPNEWFNISRESKTKNYAAAKFRVFSFCFWVFFFDLFFWVFLYMQIGPRMRFIRNTSMYFYITPASLWNHSYNTSFKSLNIWEKSVKQNSFVFTMKVFLFHF